MIFFQWRDLHKKVLCILLETGLILGWIAFSCVPSSETSRRQHIVLNLWLHRCLWLKPASQDTKETWLWKGGEVGRKVDIRRRGGGRKGGRQRWEGDKGRLRVWVDQMHYTCLCGCQRPNVTNTNTWPMSLLLAAVLISAPRSGHFSLLSPALQFAVRLNACS